MMIDMLATTPGLLMSSHEKKTEAQKVAEDSFLEFSKLPGFGNITSDCDNKVNTPRTKSFAAKKSHQNGKVRTALPKKLLMASRSLSCR